MINRDRAIMYEAQIVEDYCTSGQFMEDYRDDIHTEDDMQLFLDRCTIDDVPDEYIEERMSYYFLQEDEYINDIKRKDGELK